MGEDIERARHRARAIEKRVEEAKKSLAGRVVEGQAGGGLVRASVTGDQRILSIEIAPDAIDPARAAELKALVLEAVNDGLSRSKELTRSVLAQATGGARIPGF